jgi:hypothetical protein
MALIRSHEGRLLAVAPDPDTAAAVDRALAAADAPVARFVAGDKSPTGWQRIAAAPGCRPLGDALGLQPGRVLLVRPDLHSAGCVAPEHVAGLLACYCHRQQDEVLK